jgi:hypothetical protein
MKKISILFVALIGLFSASCDKDFEEVNTTPNNPVAVPAHLMLGTIVRVNQNTIYDMFNGGDMGMCWAQQVSKVQYNDEERYIPRIGSMDAIWNTLYASVISDAKSMYLLAEAEENTNLMAISLVLQANAFQILTDLYGPIPYTESCNPTILKPAYDSQEVVYDGIIDLLTQAETLLASGSGVVPASSDLVYAGNVSKWRKLANSLKFKALMRISKAPGQSVSAELQALVNGGQLFSSNDDSAQLIYLAAQPDSNPIYETIIFTNRTEYKLSSVMIAGNYNATTNPNGFKGLTFLNDDRLEVFAQKNTAGNYVGNIPGVENVSTYGAFSSLGTKYLDPTLPGVILSNAQVQFLLAEAANEGYITGGVVDAQAYYFKGITANFEFNGISGLANAYIGQANIGFAGQVVGRQKIAEQSWIALFGQGFEAWTEYRRTGFPVLSAVANAAPGVTVVPTRIRFNSLEVSLNKANYEAAVSTLVGGDKLTSRLWWMN